MEKASNFAGKKGKKDGGWKSHPIVGVAKMPRR
jgi:hypothetical protein